MIPPQSRHHTKFAGAKIAQTLNRKWLCLPHFMVWRTSFLGWRNLSSPKTLWACTNLSVTAKINALCRGKTECLAFFTDSRKSRMARSWLYFHVWSHGGGENQLLLQSLHDAYRLLLVTLSFWSSGMRRNKTHLNSIYRAASRFSLSSQKPDYLHGAFTASLLFILCIMNK